MAIDGMQPAVAGNTTTLIGATPGSEVASKPLPDTIDTTLTVASGDASTTPGVSYPVLPDASPSQMYSSRPYSVAVGSMQMAMRCVATLDDLFVTVQDGVHDDMKRQGQQLELKMDNIRKEAAQADKAANASIISKIFGWIAKAFALIALSVGVAVGLLTGGALSVASGAAMVVLILACYMSAWDIVASAVKEARGTDISLAAGIAAIAMANGETKEKAALIGQMCALAITLVVAVVGTVATAATSITDVLAKIVTTLVSIANAFAAAGSAGATIGHAALAKKLADTQADGVLYDQLLEAMTAYVNSGVDKVQALWDSIDAAFVNTLEIFDQHKRSQQAWVQNI